MSKIDRLTIKGFKSIRNLNDFELRSLNVLIGPNGAGKSNFVSYFKMLGEIVERRLQVWTRQQGSADRIVSFGVKETSKLESSIEFGSNSYKFELLPTTDGSFVFDQELAGFQGPTYDQPYWKVIGSGQIESNLKSTKPKNKIAIFCYQSISEWKIFHFHDTSDTASVKRLGSLSDFQYLRSDAANLAAFLYRLKNIAASEYLQIIQVIRLAIPFFDDFVLDPQSLPDGEEQIRLLWRQKNSDYALWPSQLSDGSLRFICLATALLQPKLPSTIVIDEPELGLHPYAITLLGSLIRSASKKTQVIISTQSVALVNEFAIEDLVIVESEEGATVFKRLEPNDFQSWLEEYSTGELWEKNVLGGRPR
jgi:predicted ATPase